MKPRSGQLRVAEAFVCHPAEIDLAICRFIKHRTCYIRNPVACRAITYQQPGLWLQNGRVERHKLPNQSRVLRGQQVSVVHTGLHGHMQVPKSIRCEAQIRCAVYMFPACAARSQYMHAECMRFRSLAHLQHSSPPFWFAISMSCWVQ